MNIKEELQNNKLTLIAADKLIKDFAADMGLNLNGSLTILCENVGVNRTQVYERKNQLEKALAELELAGSGRPTSQSLIDSVFPESHGWELREKVLLYRLKHPGAMVAHSSGRVTYSDGFIRFILDLLDEWKGLSEWFCKQVQVPYPTLNGWCKKDEKQAYAEHQDRSVSFLPVTASEDFKCIVEDFATWDGPLGPLFLSRLFPI